MGLDLPVRLEVGGLERGKCLLARNRALPLVCLHHGDAEPAMPGVVLPEVDFINVLLPRQEIEPVEVGDGDAGVHATRSSSEVAELPDFASSSRSSEKGSPAAAFLFALGMAWWDWHGVTGEDAGHKIGRGAANGKGAGTRGRLPRPP